MGRRSDQLLAAVDEFNHVHNKWVSADDRPNPDETYWDAIDKLFHAFAHGDIPAECRDVANDVAQFAAEAEAFDEREDHWNAYPHDGFWDARESLEKLRQRPAAEELKPLESIKLLHEQKVSHEQIARMYELWRHNGEPATHLVQRELDQPGSVIGPDWIDPRIRQREKDRKLSSEKIQTSLQRKAARANINAQACPETPKDLWEQKVSIEQSAKMLCIPMAEVKEMFDQFDRERKAMLEQRAITGGPLPETDTPTIPALADASGVVDDDSAVDDGPEIQQAVDVLASTGNVAEDSADHLDLEIIELYREGRSPQSIKDELKIDGRKVAAVIRAHQGRQATEGVEQAVAATA